MSEAYLNVTDSSKQTNTHTHTDTFRANRIGEAKHKNTMKYEELNRFVVVGRPVFLEWLRRITAEDC